MAIKGEAFSDMLRRLYPEENHQDMVPGGNFVRTITFQVTEACNMACTYCYQHDKTPKRMSFETGKKFIDLLLEPSEKSSGYITSTECPGCILEFIGGEPFLEIELIDQLTDYFLERCMELNHPWATRYRISFTSNGISYFEPKVQQYLRKHKGMVSLSVTIDGNKEMHDACRLDLHGNPTYDRAIAAADHWRQISGYKNLSSKVTLSPYNVNMTSKALIDLIDHGYEVIHCNCVYEKGWEIEHATVLYEELKNVADYLLDNNLQDKVQLSILDNVAGTPQIGNDMPWCGGSGLMMCVAPDGNIYPCLRYTPSSIGQNTKLITIGNVDDGFLSTPEEQQTLQCMKCVTRSSQCKGKECENCPIKTCCGDCAAYSWEVTGKIGERTTFHCDTHKARILAMVYYRNKKYIAAGSNNRFKMYIPKDWATPIIGEDEYEMLLCLSEVN